jgi:hypothetical protein
MEQLNNIHNIFYSNKFYKYKYFYDKFIYVVKKKYISMHYNNVTLFCNFDIIGKYDTSDNIWIWGWNINYIEKCNILFIKKKIKKYIVKNNLNINLNDNMNIANNKLFYILHMIHYIINPINIVHIKFNNIIIYYVITDVFNIHI